MRDILFRSRDRNGKWLYGSLLIYPDGDCYICVDDGKETDVLAKYAVDPSTVGQYTGQADKNGVKMLEGDIVKYTEGNSFQDDERPENATAKYECKSVIKYIDGEFFPRYMCEHTADYFYSYGFFDFEVIGNIHDNPELLKGV